MFQYKPHVYYPSSKELPDSDDTPVDNELQDLIPGLLKAILALIWADRQDWFFGVDMGVYYDPEQPAIVPDGFLSLGVPRVFDENLRLSYPLWEEKVIPTFVLEVVSQTYRGEYKSKKTFYQNLGVLYYVIYDPNRKRKPRLEVHRLVNGEYVLQPGNQVWLPEIGLAIGIERGTYLGIAREWMYWYNQSGDRFPTSEERVIQAESRLQQTESRAQKLEAQLRALGIDPV
jgi:Uma2 family endonuclease